MTQVELKESFAYTIVTHPIKAKFHLGTLFLDYFHNQDTNEFLVYMFKSKNFIYLKPFVSYDSYFFQMLFEKNKIIKVPISQNVIYKI